MSAFKFGAYGGTTGRGYFDYLEPISTNEISEIGNIPFVFAFQLARATKANNVSFHVADDILFADLQSVSSEVGAPIIVLFDECNVLRGNRIILEKVRNIFMNMTGYMLVFAATEDFFPVMDEVFSPIMRQFKRIDIGPFKSEADVRQCILTPLTNLGISRPDVRRLVPATFISDADALSGRRPYEIMLICHTLFKRCQQGDAKRFGLDLKTIEGIQRELASGQDVEDRPRIRAARSLNRKTFAVLNAVCGTGEQVSADDAWRIEYLFHGSVRATKEGFYEGIRNLVRAGIIEETDTGIRFLGDEFERIYFKYIARQKNTRLLLAPRPFEIFVMEQFVDALSQFTQIISLSAMQITDHPEDISGLIAFIGEGEVGSVKGLEMPPLVEDLLGNLLLLEAGDSVILYEMLFSSNLGSSQFWFVWREPDHVAGLRKLAGRMEEMKARARSVEFEITTKRWTIVAPRPEQIVARLKELDNEQLSTRIAATLMDEIPEWS